MTPEQLSTIRTQLAEADRSTQYERELLAPTWEDVSVLLAEVDRLQAVNMDRLREIEAWKLATGLERGGEPYAVTPEDLEESLRLATARIAQLEICLDEDHGGRP